MRKLIRGLYCKYQYIKIALRDINKPKLGDIVYYNNIKCSLIQGAQDPYWDLMPLTEENLSKQKRDRYSRVYISDFKMESFYKRFKFSFMFTYNFYMEFWYSMDIRKVGKISYKS